jgi:hypothetical protein
MMDDQSLCARLDEVYEQLNVMGWVVDTSGITHYYVHAGPSSPDPLTHNMETGNEIFNRGSLNHHVHFEVTQSTDFSMFRLSALIFAWMKVHNLHIYEVIPDGPHQHDDTARKIAYKRCRNQILSIKKNSTDVRMQIAVIQTNKKLCALYQSIKNKFKFHDELNLQVFENSLELLKVNTIMKS